MIGIIKIDYDPSALTDLLYNFKCLYMYVNGSLLSWHGYVRLRYENENKNSVK